MSEGSSMLSNESNDLAATKDSAKLIESVRAPQSTGCLSAIDSELQIYSSSQDGLVCSSRYCPGRPYVELQVPEGLLEIHRVIFITESHDQGFCGTPEIAGTYDGSFTWFEAGVSTLPGRNEIPRKHIQSNVTATWTFKRHAVVWDVCTADEPLQQWLGRIQSGDTIQLMLRSQFRAWVNYVKFARIEIHCRMAPNIEPSIVPRQTSVTSTQSEKEVFRQVQHNYRCHHKLPNDQNTIRLLILHPGLFGSSIHCDLVTSSLEDSETMKFEALSYCWGDATNTNNISLSHLRDHNCLESQGNFQITSGLDEALRHLRYSDNRKRVLWVDSICINQGDLQERGFQVDIMGDIYSHASSVLVWLGESDDSSRRATSLLKSVSGRDFAWEALYNTNDFGPVYPKMLGDISRFFAYPWFRRVWVVQEVWKAKNAIVFCGSDSVPWGKVVESNTWMMEGHGGGMSGFHLHTLPSIWTKLRDHRNLMNSNKENTAIDIPEKSTRFAILDLVLEGTELNSTDPRDKIYAMLGMRIEMQHKDNTPSALRSDYTKSTSEAFTELTRWWIVEYKSLRILSAVHASTNRTWQELKHKSRVESQLSTAHPSWALWHEGNGKWAKRTLGMSGLYQAAAETIPSLTSLDTLNPRHLSLTGLQIGVVLSIHPFPYFHIKDVELLEAYTRLLDPAGENGTWNFGPTFDEGQRRNDDQSDNEAKGLILDHYIAHWGNYPELQNEEVSWEEGETYSWAKASFPCHGKCFFRNSAGNFGLCPPGTNPGDLVVVLFGGSVPFILSARGNSTKLKGYELVGECYLQGEMHGAAIEKQQRGELTIEQFVLV